MQLLKTLNVITPAPLDFNEAHIVPCLIKTDRKCPVLSLHDLLDKEARVDVYRDFARLK